MKITKIFALSALLVFLLPSLVFASVKINEIAWMGTSVSSSDEWIELYNPDATNVDLAGWSLGWNTTVVNFQPYSASSKVGMKNLTIAPGGYYLMERTDDTTVPNILADLIYTGALRNPPVGELLILKDKSGAEVSRVDASNGWPAGDLDKDKGLTMQRSGDAWITATATPREVNSATPISADSTTDTSSATSDSNADNSSVSNDPFLGLSAHSSPVDLSTKIEEARIYATAGRDRLALVGAPITFEEKLFNSKFEVIDGGNVSWSYGDGQTGTGKRIVHSYKFPGDYAVVMNVVYIGDTYVARTNVRVILADLVIVEATPDLVKIFNRSNYEANLGGWSLATDRSTFMIPQDTIILPKKEAIIAIESTNIDSNFREINLMSPSKSVASTFSIKKDEVKNQKLDLPAHLPDHTVVRAGGQDGDSRTDPVSNPSSQIAAVLLGAEQKLLEAKKQLGNSVSKDQVVKTAETLGSSASKRSEVALEQPATTTIRVITKPRSIFKALLDLPRHGFGYIKSFF